jgi:hypothetical protein
MYRQYLYGSSFIWIYGAAGIYIDNEAIKTTKKNMQ